MYTNDYAKTSPIIEKIKRLPKVWILKSQELIGSNPGIESRAANNEPRFIHPGTIDISTLVTRLVDILI